MGQLAFDSTASRRAQYDGVLARARAVKDSALIRRLTSDTSAPVRESEVFKVGGELYRARSIVPIIRTGLRAPEYTLLDGLNVRKGASFVARHLRYDADDHRLRHDATVNLPVFMLLGRHDLNTPSTLAAEFLSRLRAPLKQVVWFESSAHFPFWEESRRFHSTMRAVADSTKIFYRRATP
jgi:pimeloyl-ACP methyl ester carboxylesterase